ncbi:MAG: hypothetical protein AAGA18_08670 [Verrucomicrobiota bacterium]
MKKYRVNRVNRVQYIKIVATWILLTILALPVIAKEKTKGPNGGRVMKLGKGYVEFFASKKHFVEVRLLDKSLKAFESSDSEVKVVAQASSGKQELGLIAKEEIFIALQPLPSDVPYELVLKVKVKPNGKFQDIPFVYDTTLCQDCNLAKYVCIFEEN